MKKYILAALLLLTYSTAKAEDGVLANFGSVKVLVPFADLSAVYLFDGVAKQSLVGAETPLLEWKKVQFTGGAVTSVEGEGTPFVGIHVVIENPARNFVPLHDIKPGIFGGRNFNTNEWMVGFKASVSVFQ